MKSPFVLIFFLLFTLSISGQNCPYLAIEFSDLTAVGKGGIWTGRYDFIEVEKDGLPPHSVLYLGNHFVKSKTGGKYDLITVYGFNKDKYTNFVKLYSWKGYEIEIKESFARIWVIIYNEKISNEEHHSWCTKMLEFTVGRLHGNPNF